MKFRLLIVCLFKVVLCVNDSIFDGINSETVTTDVIIPDIVNDGSLARDASHLLDISKNCSRGLETFTEKVTNLTRCIVVNARPIRLCTYCEDNFKATWEAYNNLKKEPSPCHKFYFESDQIGIINQVYDQGNDLWTQNSCQNCQDYMNDTVEFFRVSRDFENCVVNYNGTSLTDLNNTCDTCQEFFVKMNEIYKEFVKRISNDESGGVCMDIVDKMNITRHIWSSQDCLRFDSYVGYPNIITAVLVGAMPIFFYMLSKNISIIEDVKLVRPKRKSYASLASESVPSD